ncbi:16S rRNA (uracil(1498)-N(3))-methyltransferase [Castellaniella sp. GW247-6E4]|uniref:16S rRNA (uracil(1498)-N(3))-methyltransferase n=1 Tax=Castellaniella sp. GW247-6E4 TaxID=3140380 RepID=UPI003314C60D
MPAPRFHCPTPLAPHARIDLPEALAHHALRVLRLRPGAAITLFDGHGGEYAAVLRVDGGAAWADTGAHDPVERELPGRITLLQGLAGGDKMDWIVEKAVETGAARLVPIAAERSILRLAGPRLDKRLARWRAIAGAASEQCGRNRLMSVVDPLTFGEALDLLGAEDGPALFCHPEGAVPLAQALAPVRTRLSLLVGPEGGWSEAEQAAAAAAGLVPVVLGPRVLRTETAGLALIAAATALLGW